MSSELTQGNPASDEQPHGKQASDEQVKGGKAKQSKSKGKGKQVSGEETILTPEEEAAKKAEKAAADAKYHEKRDALKAFIGDAIDGKFPMTTVQYVLLLIQFALMRFTDESLQMDIGGKTLKQRLGGFVRALSRQHDLRDPATSLRPLYGGAAKAVIRSPDICDFSGVAVLHTIVATE